MCLWKKRKECERGMILKNIYQELILIRKELQSIRSAVEPKKIDIKFRGKTISHQENHD